MFKIRCVVNINSLFIRYLDVSRCGIISVSSDIGGCKELTELVLQGNSLSEVPPCVELLRNLKNIRLDRNNIYSFGKLEVLTQLKSITLSLNVIKKVPACIASFTRLTMLDLRFNELPSECPFDFYERRESLPGPSNDVQAISEFFQTRENSQSASFAAYLVLTRRLYLVKDIAKIICKMLWTSRDDPKWLFVSRAL